MVLVEKELLVLVLLEEDKEQVVLVLVKEEEQLLVLQLAKLGIDFEYPNCGYITIILLWI